MFERYTEKARRVIFYSREFASGLGANAIEPPHILMGLMREDQQLFKRLGNKELLQLDSIRERIRTSAGTRGNPSVDMPLSVESKRVLQYAEKESEQLNHRNIGTEHLLLGLLREQTIATEILTEHGLQLSSVRDELRKGSEAVVDTPRNDSIDEMRKLAADARDLGASIVKKAARIEAICDQLEKSTRNKEDKH